MTEIVVVENGGQTVVEVTQSPAYRLDVISVGSTIEVSAVGVQGPSGATGPQGPPGPTGPAGETNIDNISLDGGNF